MEGQLRKATLIYNKNARHAETVDVDAMLTRLGELGYNCEYCSKDELEELDDELSERGGLFLVVGGDGTIRRTGLKLINRPDVELMVIPAGTANNIARTLGINMSPLDLIASLPDSVALPYDVGRLRGVLGDHYFMEACGCGVIADAMATYNPDEGKSVVRALRTMIDTLPAYQAREFSASLDGKLEEGKFVLLELLNTSMTGPRLRLAPEATTNDGLLEVLRIQESERHGFIEYARRMQAESLSELENVELSRARQVEILWNGFPLHLDDEILGYSPPAQGTDVAAASQPVAVGTIVIDVLPAALTFRLPRQVAEELRARRMAQSEASQ
jgi:diacylglycerol kinase family enzyme